MNIKILIPIFALYLLASLTANADEVVTEDTEAIAAAASAPGRVEPFVKKVKYDSTKSEYAVKLFYTGTGDLTTHQDVVCATGGRPTLVTISWDPRGGRRHSRTTSNQVVTVNSNSLKDANGKKCETKDVAFKATNQKQSIRPEFESASK